MIFLNLIVHLIFLELVVCCQESVVDLPGNCPKGVHYIKNYDIDKQLMGGIWYLQYVTFDLADIECFEDCFTLYIAAFDNITTNLNACCQRGPGPFCGQVLGSGIFTYRKNDTKTLRYRTGDLEVVGNIISNEADHWIGFFCIPTKKGDPIIKLYAYSRKTNPEPVAYKEYVERLMIKNNLDPATARKVDQGSQCFYSARPAVLNPYIR